MDTQVNFSLKFLFLSLLKCTLFFLLLSEQLIAAEKNTDSSLLFIAASTNEVIKEASELWIKENGSHKFRISSASSGILAKQIISGAPVDLYISASYLWIEELIKRKLINAKDINVIFSNSLVLISHKDSNYPYIGDITKNIQLEKLIKSSLSNRRMSIADPSHVPAGIYTKQVLQKLHLWDRLSSNKLAFGLDVRKTLKFVALGSSPLGIVYYSDAIAEPEVKIIGFFDEKLHEPIKYWAALITKNDNQNMKKFLKFLLDTQIQTIYTKHGFKIIGG